MEQKVLLFLTESTRWWKIPSQEILPLDFCRDWNFEIRKLIAQENIFGIRISVSKVVNSDWQYILASCWVFFVLKCLSWRWTCVVSSSWPGRRGLFLRYYHRPMEVVRKLVVPRMTSHSTVPHKLLHIPLSENVNKPIIFCLICPRFTVFILEHTPCSSPCWLYLVNDRFDLW